jgi:uncharacterized protein (DUF924 family)
VETQLETQESIKEFWFGNNTDDAATAQAQAKLWWSKDDAQDRLITQRFATMTAQAGSGLLGAWLATAAGRQALILLCDQFPRNMYRNTPQSFAFDAKALQIAKDGLALQMDQQLRPIERVFFYLPLEHSEALADQEHAVRLFDALVKQSQPEHQTVFQNFLNFAIRHRDVIARFGRFPHRNAILGRVSTDEEVQFLSEPGSSF